MYRYGIQIWNCYMVGFRVIEVNGDSAGEAREKIWRDYPEDMGWEQGALVMAKENKRY